MLAIAAHIPSTEIGIDYFQATHPEVLFKECSHYVELVHSPDQLPQILGRAIRTAIARKGVAVVVVPGNVALGPLAQTCAEVERAVRPGDSPIEQRHQQARHSPEPLVASDLALWGGLQGCSFGSHRACPPAAGAPIVHSLRGKEYIEYDNPLDVGMTGLVGFASGYSAMKSCDMLLMLGTDFPYRQFYPEKVTIAQVDTRAEALGNRCPIELGVLGSVKDTLNALVPMIEEKTDSNFLNRALDDYRKARKSLDALAEPEAGSSTIHPQYVTRLVSELADEDAIFSCDVGTPIAWAARYLKMNGKRRLVGSFNHGSMANSLLHSIGAQAAFRNRQVISMSGDGGFTMMMGEFLTLIQTGLPVKVVVLNNGTLGFVEMEMKASGFLDTGCDLKNPNFAAMANAMGIKGVRVEHPAELEDALGEAFAHPGPALVDVVSARQELVMPPSTTGDQAYHFGLFMLRAVMDGRGQQLVDLAKVNLFR